MQRNADVRRRRKIAKALESAAVPERPFLHGLRYIVHPDVCGACAPSLLAIAALLRDDTHSIDREICREVLAFVTDGASPLFGRDESEAMRTAVLLQHAVIEALQPVSQAGEAEPPSTQGPAGGRSVGSWESA